ncbi:hypothetical protein B0T44_25800 [Nocardia donostiensis]|uniref:Uncharacterized protein n=1 Tax=Nocardia donostiensis TaxID=1538463 RepID=A0A1W0AUF4_9NOCA|nr:hypothetical protein B0T46_14425 [Nocardia donostiensis]OQS13834.1 hypothetical protein B0T36_16955 [Nocardia donostiensis]OQS16039.1 hypothetical protein B0T44_25800 [Nocardia donostiensis]
MSLDFDLDGVGVGQRFEDIEYSGPHSERSRVVTRRLQRIAEMGRGNKLRIADRHLRPLPVLLLLGPFLSM